MSWPAISAKGGLGLIVGPSLVVVAMVPGSRGPRRDRRAAARLLARPPDEGLIAFGVGLPVDAGAAVATGCVVGNILSGWAPMSIGRVRFRLVTVLANRALAALDPSGSVVAACRRCHTASTRKKVYNISRPIWRQRSS